MAQPEGYNDGTGRVCRLRKTLYGLKQSGREWNLELNSRIRESADGTEIITVWVDDLLLFSDHASLGEPKKIVGIEITRDRQNRSVQLSQTKYIESILQKQGLQSCNPVGMPLDPKIMLEKEETDQEGNRSNGYASLVGSLMYLAVATRPDIAYAIQRLSTFTIWNARA